MVVCVVVFFLPELCFRGVFSVGGVQFSKADLFFALLFVLFRSKKVCKSSVFWECKVGTENGFSTTHRMQLPICKQTCETQDARENPLFPVLLADQSNIDTRESSLSPRRHSPHPTAMGISVS